MTTMQRTAAAAGSAVFFALAPGTIVGLVPWLITDWHPGAPLSHLVPLRVLGAVLVVAGTAILVSAFARFVVEGLGTPAPVALGALGGRASVWVWGACCGRFCGGLFGVDGWRAWPELGGILEL